MFASVFTRLSEGTENTFYLLNEKCLMVLIKKIVQILPGKYFLTLLPSSVAVRLENKNMGKTFNPGLVLIGY